MKRLEGRRPSVPKVESTRLVACWRRMRKKARFSITVSLAGALLALGCDGELPVIDPLSLAPPPPPGVAMPAPPTPGPSTTVDAFVGTYFYFLPSDDKRTSDVTVHFPPMPLAYEKVTLNLALRCPPAGCDFWDRRASLSVVRHEKDPATGKDVERLTEIFRFVTPYRVGTSWSTDVTELRPLLSGDVTLRLFITTYVGPGHAMGAGWLADVSFDMVGGLPPRLPIAVIPLWDGREFPYGNPAKPISASVVPQTVTLPPNAGSVAVRAFVTGHGQGNLDNCAEFCRRTHQFNVGAAQFSREIWRTDCATTAAPGQFGTYSYPRAGWCPGASVPAWLEDVTAAVTGPTVTVGYDVSSYENSCRPDAPICGGCSLQTGCAYDGNNHTEPVYSLSAALIVYGR